MPKDWCPFCPGSGRVPDQYDVYLYPNDFAALSFSNPQFEPAPGIFASTGAEGSCDVVLYSPEHTKLPSQLSVDQWEKVIGLWTKRTLELFDGPVAYVAVFENTGEAIGVTMPHPHGQIYAFPFLPPLIKTEIDSATEVHRLTGACLYCGILEAELKQGTRIISQNKSFVAFLPYHGRFPTEGSIYSRRHFGSLMDMTSAEARDLASMISIVRRKYDALYGFPLPLMMLIRQRPAKGVHDYFHFHLDFLPIQRSATKLKYLAAVESGTGTFLNDTRAEEQAALMREAEPRS